MESSARRTADRPLPRRKLRLDGEAKQVGKAIIFDLTNINGAPTTDFEQLLVRFFEGHAYQTKTPKQLALALAKKTRLLSKQVEEALEEVDEKSNLRKLRDTFEKTLIQDISLHQFANMVAETMAYSLFLSALEHERRGNGNALTLTNAIDYLPTNVPILADLYELIKKVASSIPNIFESAQLLVDQLNASEISRIRQKLVEHKPGEDPVIQFYEPFLAEYDPKEREARGVYYTPKPVVDYKPTGDTTTLAGIGQNLLHYAMDLTVSVNDLVNGKKIECKDIMEMLAVEGQIREAAQNFANVLRAASQFGGEEVIEL